MIVIFTPESQLRLAIGEYEKAISYYFKNDAIKIQF